MSKRLKSKYISKVSEKVFICISIHCQRLILPQQVHQEPIPKRVLYVTASSIWQHVNEIAWDHLLKLYLRLKWSPQMDSISLDFWCLDQIDISLDMLLWLWSKFKSGCEEGSNCEPEVVLGSNSILQWELSTLLPRWITCPHPFQSRCLYRCYLTVTQ